jgi:hypothetical protein
MSRLALSFAITVGLLPALPGCGSTEHAAPDASHDARALHDAARSGDGGVLPDAPMDAISFDGGSSCFPPCLASLLASCQPEGACSESESGGNGARCYANGVKVVSALIGSNHERTSFSKNGSLCFVQDYLGIGGTATMSTTSAVTTYTGPGGGTIATEHDVFTGSAPTSTVTCNGVMYALNFGSAACEDADGGAPCVAGTCM